MRLHVIHFHTLVRWSGRWLGRALALVSAVNCLAGERPHIIVLYSNDRILPANQEMENGLRRAFSGEVGNPSADLFGEFLDAVRFPSPEFGMAMEQFLKARHRDNPPALCISIGPQALDFLMRRRDSLFPGVPVVFGGVTPSQISALPAGSDLAGRPMDWSITPLLEKLPEIRPEIRKILLIAGAAEFDQLRHKDAMGQIEPFRSRYECESSVGQDLKDVLERVSKLPDDTLVFYLTYFKTPDGRSMIPLEVAGRVAKASRVPVVCFYDTYIGSGVLGGAVMSFEEEGFAIGGIARRVLQAGRAGEIGTLPPGKSKLVFDDRAMKRHGWAPGKLPPGAEIRFKSPGLWEAHRNTVLFGIGALGLQSVLIVGLFAARTRQRIAEGERKQSESRFTGVFRSSPVSISIIRRQDGRIVDVNPAWERTTHVTRDQAIGRKHIEIGFEFEGGPNDWFLVHHTSGKTLKNFEQRLKMPDGTSRLLSISTELLDLRGEPCYVSMAQDITDREEAEETRQQLAQASRLGMLGELTASIAHEVNQPLGAILSNAEAAEILMASENPPLDEIRDILADIRRDDLRADEIIRHVRSMVARDEVCMVPLDPGSLASGVAGLVRHDCKRRGIILDCEVAAGMPQVRGGKVQLEQVLLNLLLNAMDAVKDQNPDDKTIRITVALTEDGRVDIAISDTGKGILPEILPRVFDNFFTTKKTGMGLGLALSRSIAEAHGGSLIAENTPSGGAVFHFIIPPCHDS